MGEYISQEAIKNALVDKFKARIGSSHVPTWNDAFDAVTNLPPAADVVEVVRCADCKYDERCMFQDFVRDERVEPYDKTVFYCADGKRKDGGQDDV